VVTTWDWGDEKHYLHDLISPTGASRPSMPTAAVRLARICDRHAADLDPKTHTVTIFNAPVRDANTPEA